MITKLEKTKLWSIFKKNSDVAIQGTIKNILNETIPLLDQIVRVFPTYTNHNGEHSLKIITNIEMILGEDIEQLSSTEACVLLLSSFWHDLGMVCNKDDEILQESWFEEYCESNSKCKKDSLDTNIVADYIRINHHNRLSKYLYDTDSILDNNNKEISFNGFPIVEIAYKVAMSHNDETSKLEELKKFNSNDDNNDFVFCAILLRLADILDFDNDRTSTSTYKFLGLENPTDDAKKYSQGEWKKHLSNYGFDYKNNILYFKTTPDNPNVEFEIRNFIKIIEFELEKCRDIFKSHCYKWNQDFLLPKKIDLSGIKSIGYKYGDFKFTFDNNKTLDLLTGNNIYSNKLIFIRELLQNSIDASLYKESLKKRNGFNDFKSKPIEITDWHDKNDGSYWIRIDDYGIGMDEYVLLNYFTKIGKSFYESKDFNGDIDFKAISRFGIGILSCFMVANNIEISTKKENSEAIRFSIKSLHSYFITQLENEHPNVDIFPSIDNETSHKYRKEVGTSIAIKLDFNKINRWFDIKDELEKHIFYSPIEVQYKKQKVATTLSDLDKNPWIDKETIVELNKEDDSKIKLLFDIKDMNERFKLKILPVNLSTYSPTPKIKAQMVLVEVITEIPKVDDKFNRYFEVDKDSFVGGLMKLVANKRDNQNNKEGREQIDLDKYSEFIKFRKLLTSKIGHNGIFIGKDFTNTFNTRILNFTRNNIFSLAHISLSDNFRPSMNISRASDIKFDYRTLSASNLLLSRYITQNKFVNKAFDCTLIYDRFNYDFTIEQIKEDIYLKEWKKEKIFKLENNKYKSLNEIKKLLVKGQKIKIVNYPRINNMGVDYIEKEHTRGMFVEILSQFFTKGLIDYKGHYNIEKVFSNLKSKENDKYFPIGFFLKYNKNIEDSLQLKVNWENYGVNKNHIFSKWLYSNASLLDNKYKGIFEDIKSVFMERFGNDNIFEKLESLLNLLQKLEPNILDKEIIKSIETLNEET